MIEVTQQFRDPLYRAEHEGDVNRLVTLCGGLAREAGWNNTAVDIPCSLMLTVSELAEAMEGHRKGLADDKLPQYPMLGVELADACIRIFHLADRLGYDLGAMLIDKLVFNTTRDDHKAEHRNAPGGKAY